MLNHKKCKDTWLNQDEGHRKQPQDYLDTIDLRVDPNNRSRNQEDVHPERYTD